MSLPQGSQLKIQVPCGVCCRLQARSEVPEGVVPGSIQTLGWFCGGFDVASRMVPDLENLGAHCRLVAPEITGGSGFGDDWMMFAACCQTFLSPLRIWGCYLGLLHQKTLVLHQKHVGVKHYYELMGLSDHGGYTTNIFAKFWWEISAFRTIVKWGCWLSQ